MDKGGPTLARLFVCVHTLAGIHQRARRAEDPARLPTVFENGRA